jgi:hypothetical protein
MLSVRPGTGRQRQCATTTAAEAAIRALEDAAALAEFMPRGVPEYAMTTSTMWCASDAGRSYRRGQSLAPHDGRPRRRNVGRVLTGWPTRASFHRRKPCRSSTLISGASPARSRRVFRQVGPRRDLPRMKVEPPKTRGLRSAVQGATVWSRLITGSVYARRASRIDPGNSKARILREFLEPNRHVANQPTPANKSR